MSGNAREEILGRIRTALGGPARIPAGPVPRDYTGAGQRTSPETLQLLVDRLLDYEATVHRVAPEQLPAAVADAVAAAGHRRLVVPADLPEVWLSGLDPAVVVVRDHPPVAVSDLDSTDGVVTGCSVAIATTGTLVLDAGEAQGRRVLTLVPDWHLCVVAADQVVVGVPDSLARLDPARPLTLVSGPSATSDIELQRVEGVHGPRTLVVLLVVP